MRECQKKTIIVNFITQKLKSKHTFLKKHANWAKPSHVTQNLEFSSWPKSFGPELEALELLEYISIWWYKMGIFHHLVAR